LSSPERILSIFCDRAVAMHQGRVGHRESNKLLFAPKFDERVHVFLRHGLDRNTGSWSMERVNIVSVICNCRDTRPASADHRKRSVRGIARVAMTSRHRSRDGGPNFAGGGVP